MVIKFNKKMVLKKNYPVICPNCKLKIYLTKEELYGEKYITCWSCNELFININFVNRPLLKV